MSEAPGERGARAGHREILALAVPIMVSNVSTPLLGIVDTAVVGRLPDPAHVGAVAVGALIFGFVFWAFGFLRMGTTGLTAQALGAQDEPEVRASLLRAIGIALVAGLGLIALQWPIRELAFALVDGTAQVEDLAARYFDLRIYSAPAALTSYALLGWFVGLGRTGTALVLQLVLNVTNMGLDALFVLELGWGVEGVALGTLAAEWVAAVVGVAVASRRLRASAGSEPVWDWQRLMDREGLRRTFAVGGDIMIRSLALVFAFSFFMAQGAGMGEVLLAANAVLMQFVNASAYLLDGLAFAAEALVGRAVGARDPGGVRHAARQTTLWAAGLAVALSAGLWVLGELFVRGMIVDPAARLAAETYLFWAAAAPFVGVWAFQLDGIFIGATRTAQMRNASLVSLAFFLGAWVLGRPFGNHGLWAALHVHYLARAGTLLWHYPGLVAVVDAPPRAAPRTEPT